MLKGDIMLTKKQLRAMSRELTSNPEDYMDSFRKNVQMYIDQREITISEVAEKERFFNKRVIQ